MRIATPARFFDSDLREDAHVTTPDCTYVFIPGAGGSGWSFSFVVAELERRDDVPPDVTTEAMAQGELRQSATPFGDAPLGTPWPDVPTRVLVGRDDRFFPAAFQRRVAQERLGIAADELPGGHLLALSRPGDLADRLERYWGEVAGA